MKTEDLKTGSYKVTPITQSKIVKVISINEARNSVLIESKNYEGSSVRTLLALSNFIHSNIIEPIE